MLQHSIVREKLKYSQPDIYVDVPVSHFGVLDLHKFREIFAAADAAKDQLRRQLDRVITAPTLEAE